MLACHRWLLVLIRKRDMWWRWSRWMVHHGWMVSGALKSLSLFLLLFLMFIDLSLHASLLLYDFYYVHKSHRTHLTRSFHSLVPHTKRLFSINIWKWPLLIANNWCQFRYDLQAMCRLLCPWSFRVECLMWKWSNSWQGYFLCFFARIALIATVEEAKYKFEERKKKSKSWWLYTTDALELSSQNVEWIID